MTLHRKAYRLAPNEIASIVVGLGSCLASDMITVEGYPVRFMYREQPDGDIDSGWRFFSGLEDEDYTENSRNFDLYDVNTIANYDRTIVEYLDAPVGSVYEKHEPEDAFVAVTDWSPPSD